MKRCCLFLTLALLAACNRPGSFTFVQMSDTQIGFRDDSPAFCHSDSLMKLAVDATNALRPACVVVTGDLLDDNSNPVQDSIYRVRLAELEAPVYMLPGNHDYSGSTPEKREAYISRRGYDRFAFRKNGCGFIGINSNTIKDDAEEMEAEQWAWLEKKLAASRDCKYTFIFLHCPVIRESIDEEEDYFNFPKDKRRKYIDLFKKYGVDIVFAGHLHRGAFAEVDGIRFVTAGPVGNPLGDGISGYNVVTVGKDGVDVQYLASK